MKKNRFLFLMLCFSMTSYAQEQRDYAQELVILLKQERYFEARDFKLQYTEHLPKNVKMFDLLYDIPMSVAFNKPDSAIVYLEEFLGNQKESEQLAGTFIASYYIQLYKLYEEKQQFEKAITTVEKFRNYLERNPFSLESEFIKEQKQIMQILITSLKKKSENEPIRKITRDSDACKIKLKDDPYIRFDAKYNGQTIETFFNTSIYRFLLMEKDLADEIGVKYKLDSDHTQTMHGKQVRALEGVIDSINIKGVKLYNIPVVVVCEKFSSTIPSHLDADCKNEFEKLFYKERQIVMGVPMMKMIGRFEFDWELNTLCLPQNQASASIIPASNLVIIKNIPYLNMRINDTDFTGLLDAGGSQFLNLTFPYFFKALCESEGTQSFKIYEFAGIYENVEHNRVKDPQVFFDGRNINSSDPGREVYAVDMAGIDNNKCDGAVGIKFIKNIGSKCIIDFDAMTVECKE